MILALVNRKLIRSNGHSPQQSNSDATLSSLGNISILFEKKLKAIMNFLGLYGQEVGDKRRVWERWRLKRSHPLSNARGWQGAQLGIASSPGVLPSTTGYLYRKV
jgi:hypothetical protein